MEGLGQVCALLLSLPCVPGCPALRLPCPAGGKRDIEALAALDHGGVQVGGEGSQAALFCRSCRCCGCYNQASPVS